MFVLNIVIVVLAVGLAATFAFRASRKRGKTAFASEALLLEEAIITEPIAPGMEGRAEIRKPGAEPLALRVRASDASQVFVRGAMVRVIDFRKGCCFIESSDEEHLVR